MHKSICKYCESEFTKTSKNQCYCSPQCREDAWKKRRNQRKSGQTAFKQCLWCGEVFKEDKHKHVYCSKKCRTYAIRKRERDRYRREFQHKCWDCKKYASGCSWSEKGEPIKTWKAKPVKRKHKGKYIGIGYKVIECPEFISDNKTGD